MYKTVYTYVYKKWSPKYLRDHNVNDVIVWTSLWVAWRIWSNLNSMIEFLGALGLERNCAKYAYLKESGCISVKTINDVEDFRYTEVQNDLYSCIINPLDHNSVSYSRKFDIWFACSRLWKQKSFVDRGIFPLRDCFSIHSTLGKRDYLLLLFIGNIYEFWLAKS